MIDGHTAFGLIVGAFVLGMLVMEWAAHDSSDRNRRDAVPFNDHADEAIELVKRVIIP